MSDENVPPTPPPEPPPEPPADPPSPPPAPTPSSSGTGGSGGQPNALMIILSYLYILAIVPLLVEKEDADVQWHAKHGLVLLGVDIVAGAFFFILGMVSGGLGCLLFPLQLLIHGGLFVVRIVCIVQGVGGKRFKLPGVSAMVDNF